MQYSNSVHDESIYNLCRKMEAWSRRLKITLSGICFNTMDMQQKIIMLSYLVKTHSSTLGIEENVNTKLASMASHEQGLVGVISSNRHLSWYKWWELVDIIPIDFDFARLLARGSSCQVSDLKGNRAIGLTMTDVLVDRTNDQSEKQEKRSAWFMNKSNSCDFKQVRKYCQNIKNYHIRTEDKGDRLLLVHKSWERYQITKFLLKDCCLLEQEQNTVSRRSRYSGTTFKLNVKPKTHKSDSNVQSRVMIDYSTYREVDHAVSKKINNWIKSQTTIEVSSREEGISRLLSNPGLNCIAIGDVKDMYPSVPLDKAMIWLKTILAKDELSYVKAVLDDRIILFESKLYKVTSGLDMGNPLSSCIARGYLTSLEMSSNTTNNEMNRVVRYVDDIAIGTCDKSQIDAINEYNNSCSNDFAIKWKISIPREPANYLGCAIQWNDKFEQYIATINPPKCMKEIWQNPLMPPTVKASVLSGHIISTLKIAVMSSADPLQSLCRLLQETREFEHQVASDCYINTPDSVEKTIIRTLIQSVQCIQNDRLVCKIASKWMENCLLPEPYNRRFETRGTQLLWDPSFQGKTGRRVLRDFQRQTEERGSSLQLIPKSKKLCKLIKG